MEKRLSERRDPSISATEAKSTRPQEGTGEMQSSILSTDSPYSCRAHVTQLYSQLSICKSLIKDKIED